MFSPALVSLGLGAALLAAAFPRPLAAQEVKPPEPPAEFNPATEPAVIAVAKVLPAVVNINAERIVRRTVQDPFERFFDQFFDEPVNRRPRELQQKVQSLGSGFLIDAEGHIVTNEHVVERAADLKIQVTLSDGASYPARYVAGDAKADLALIKIDAKERNRPFPYINLQNASPNLLGQTVLALGNPMGYNSSVSRGILSANDREIAIGDTVYKHLLQTDAAINPGNSGGPLVDLAGRLIGVSSVKLAFTPQGTPTQGLGFAIPARVVAAKIAEFRQQAANPSTARRALAAGESPITRRLFGLGLQTLTPELANALNLRSSSGGAVVSDVERDSPAARAGFRQGMIVYRLGSYAINSPAQAEALLKDVEPGTAVDFTVGLPAPARRGLARQEPQLGTVTLTARGE
jgi:serine protease Do